MKKLLFPALLALPPLLAGAASVAWSLRPPPAAPQSQYSNLPPQRLVHSNGLTLTIARTLKARRQPDGWSINAPEMTRYSASVEVSRADGPALGGEWPESRRLGSREIHFHSGVALAGGASGDELILEIQAYEETPQGRVLYLFSGPRSGSDDLLWHVVAQTTLLAPGATATQ